MDSALRLLNGALAASTGPVLWVADEQVDAACVAQVAARADLVALTNRCDVAARLSAHGIAATLADFDFSVLPPPSPRRIAFRVAKEKAIVHFVINRALEILPAGGTLLLVGYKNEGIKTYLDKAVARAGTVCQIERAEGALLGAITRGDSLGEPLPEQNYTQLQRVNLRDDLSVWSKPGVFGWQKEDAGSAFLIEHLANVWPDAPQRVLDLGCGYGYLTVLAARRWPQAEFVATDNNVAAISACERNLREENIRGVAKIADCAATIDGAFDAIICNPPFHQGFGVEGELTDNFLRSIHRLLARTGRALLVVNQFIPLEKKAAALFTQADVIARGNGFKLVVLAR